MKIKQKLEVIGHIHAIDSDTGETLLDQHNAIHTINMPRVLARGLAKEPNYNLYRLALGNAGIVLDKDSPPNAVVQPPNINTWNSGLYNETYSIIVDETSPSFDSTGGTGVVSAEVGNKSIVTVTAYISNAQPGGELSSSSISSPSGQELLFNFNEMGLFCYGLPNAATHGTSSVNVGNHVSTDELTNISPSSTLNLVCVVNGVNFTSVITIPAGGTGAGGVITFGDFCEGFNSGAWVTGGSPINTVLYTYCTDYTNGQYPSLSHPPFANLPLAYGNLVFISKTTGILSSVDLICNAGNTSDFFNQLVSGSCGNCNVDLLNGQNIGVQNDAIELHNTCPPPVSQEAERMLTYLNFNSVLKGFDRNILFTYTLTISITPSEDSSVSQSVSSA